MRYADPVDVTRVSFVTCLCAWHRVHGEYALEAVSGTKTLLRLANFDRIGAKDVWTGEVHAWQVVVGHRFSTQLVECAVG